MGLQFLKHLSRTGLLLHIVDVEPYESLESPVESARKIMNEVEKWSDELAGKSRWLVLNKIDRLQESEIESHCQRIIDELQWSGRVYRISAMNGDGTKELIFSIMDYIDQQRQKESEQG